MHTNGICSHCGSKIRFGVSLCNKCQNEKSHNAAIVSQNKKKLRKLLDEKRITLEWLDKFILYANNIISFGKVLMQYKEKNIRSAYDRIMKFGIISCWFITIGIILNAGL